MKLKRHCIYPKDVQRITGQSDRTGRRLLQRIRESLGKEDHQYVTAEEFAAYTGISLDLVIAYITD